MFTNDFIAEQHAKQHVQDMYDEIEHIRLVRKLRGSQQRQSPILRLLHWLKQDNRPVVQQPQIDAPARPVTGPLATETWH